MPAPAEISATDIVRHAAAVAAAAEVNTDGQILKGELRTGHWHLSARYILLVLSVTL
jgi:hypothetical protein